MISTPLIYPSLLSADFARLGEEIQALEKAGADGFHLDIMDGHFVPNITIGPSVVAALRRFTTLPFDVHLMVSEPSQWIEPFVKAGADSLTLHLEAEIHLDRALTAIKQTGIKAGISLVPSTSPHHLEYIAPLIDQILIMTVNPGFGGQTYLASQQTKIAYLREHYPHLSLMVDGGVNPETARLSVQAGAHILVAGHAIFKDGPEHYAAHIQQLRNAGMNL